MEENEKMRMETADITQQNIDKIAELFPNCITEAEDKEKSTLDQKVYKKTIDFNKLRQILSNDIVEGYEAYDFTWVGKKASLLEANKPIRKTLRPCINESLNWDTTENLYIEGDNLEVLKLLRESYLNKVKMIYIYPPYNTGNDFIYEDDYSQTQDEYDKECEVCDENGNRLFKNSDSRGRFHSDWCSMIYPRLFLARDLLCEDGVIFISIDDNEVANLRKICDEVFGEKNFITQICHKSRASVSNDKIISENHNHILLYAKHYDIVYKIRKDIGLDPDLNGFNLEDENGFYKLVPVDGPGEAKKGNPYYSFLGVSGYWRFSQKTMQEKYNAGLIVKSGNSLQQKYYLSQARNSRKTDTTWWDIDALTSTATKDLKTLMTGKLFDNPKNINLILRMLKLFTHSNRESIILDFFSGSATTAHAVMQLNAEDGGNRKFIMVQLPEPCDEKSEAFKAGYKNICEIGKERIRRAGAKIKEEHPESAESLDVGFRVFKVDESNMKDVYFSSQEYNQDMLSDWESNIKPDRTDLDLLFGCLLESGVPLSMPYKSEKIDGYTVHTYGDGDQIPLIACFEENIPDSVIDTIAKRQPLRVVLRDSCFKDSAAKINILERFKTFSPNTKVKVI